MKDSSGIMMIEPSSKASAVPVIDELTRKMTAVWHHRRESEYAYRGFHTCVCGATSDNKDHWVGDGSGLLTNSLCIHYLAYHRNDVPPEELDKVRKLPFSDGEPTEDELFHARQMVPKKVMR